MNCKYVKKKLINFIENEISAEEKKAIREHLDECKECRKEYYEILALFELLEKDEVDMPEKILVPFVKQREKKWWIPAFVSGVIVALAIFFVIITQYSGYTTSNFKKDELLTYLEEIGIGEKEIEEMEKYTEGDVYEEFYEIVKDKELIEEFFSKFKKGG